MDKRVDPCTIPKIPSMLVIVPLDEIVRVYLHGLNYENQIPSKKIVKKMKN